MSLHVLFEKVAHIVTQNRVVAVIERTEHDFRPIRARDGNLPLFIVERYRSMDDLGIAVVQLYAKDIVTFFKANRLNEAFLVGSILSINKLDIVHDYLPTSEGLNGLETEGLFTLYRNRDLGIAIDA